MSLPDRVSDLVPFDLLLSVARLGSLGQAAAEHGISQPAASTRIRRLERRLGVPLIERSPRGSRLTADGDLVAGWAQAVIDAAAALDAGVTSLRARSDAVLRVAASMTVAEYLLPGWLTALRARDPATAVALTAGNSAEVAAAVLDDHADLGFVEGPDVPPGLAAQPVGADRLTVVVPPGHQWARRRSGVTAADLDAGVTSLRARSDAVLRVSASMTVAEYLLPGWLTMLRARDPATAVALTAGNSAEVAAAVLDGDADLGFVEGPDLPPGLASAAVGADRLTVVVPPGHRWEKRRSGITAAELAATPLVTRERGSGTRRYFEDALRGQGGLDPVPPVAELSSTTAIKSAVAAGIGPSVLSSLAVAPELAAGTLRPVKVTGLDLGRRLLAVWATGRQLTGPAADLRTIAARSR